MVLATIGPALAADLGLTAAAQGAEGPSGAALSFGSLEPLVCLLQETSVDRINAVLVERLRSGLDLKTLTAAAALANARTFGGETTSASTR
jgi:hypothetical protein